MSREPDPHRDKRQKIDQEPGSSDLLTSPNGMINILSPIIRDLKAYDALCTSDYARLLIAIAEHSGGLLDQSYTNEKDACSVLVAKEGLKLKLLEVLRTPDSYKHILGLDYLHRPFSLDFYIDDDTFIKRGEKRTKEAWNVPYEGNNHILLFDNINNMWSPTSYTNMCSIVQSSGTGKSRMVDEQATLVYTLPMNIRSRVGVRVACPPSDDSVRAYLVEKSSEAECRKRYLVFLGSLFSRAAKGLARFDAQPRLSQSEFAVKWRELINDETYRRSFYDSVVALCTRDSVNASLEDLVHNARTDLRHLADELDKRCKTTKKVKIVLYVDEAHELDREYTYWTRRPTQLDILSSVILEFADIPLFCLALSTQLLFQFPMPPSTSDHASTSGRNRIDAGRPLAPITETPFDCAPDSQISPGVLRLEDLTEISYLAKWGRPLWWTRISGDKDRPCWERESLDELVDFARMKLLCHHDIDGFVGPHTRPAWSTVVMDVLLSFDSGPGHMASREERSRVAGKEVEMIARHMRIAYSVPQHREYLSSGYPSEPILAEAATQQVYSWQERHHSRGVTDVMLSVLKGALEYLRIDREECEGVVMRMLFMRAYMNAVRADFPNTRLFSRGCRLITFIQQLFCPEPAEAILDSQPDNIAFDTKHTFREAFANAVVRFTHFVKGNDESILTTEALFAAFARGMAFIGPPTQKYVSVVIPVLLDASETLRESVMSAVLVQVRRRVPPRCGIVYGFSGGDLGLSSSVKMEDDEDDTHDGADDGGKDSSSEDKDVQADEKSLKRPYFVLIVEPRTDVEKTNHGGEQTGKAKEEESMLEEMYISPPPKLQHETDETHPRFLATAYGCSKTLYKPVGSHSAAYQKLLGARDVAYKYTCADPKLRPTLSMLKPVWCGLDSCH